MVVSRKAKKIQSKHAKIKALKDKYATTTVSLLHEQRFS